MSIESIERAMQPVFVVEDGLDQEVLPTAHARLSEMLEVAAEDFIHHLTGRGPKRLRDGMRSVIL